MSRRACRRRSCGRQVGGPVQQRLAAQPPGDGPGFGNGEGGGASVVQAGEVPGVVEQAMGEVVGGGLFAQAADRRGEVGRGGRAGLASGKADAGQAAFGTQQRGQMPGLVVIEQGEQLTDGGSVAQVVGGASGQWPRPPQVVATDAEGADVGEDGPGVAQCGPRLAAGGGSEALHQADHRLVLQVFAGPQVRQSRQEWIFAAGEQFAGGFLLEVPEMESVLQVVAALYVALSEANGSPRAANQILRDAIDDRVIDDPLAIGILRSLAHDEDDARQLTAAMAAA